MKQLKKLHRNRLIMFSVIVVAFIAVAVGFIMPELDFMTISETLTGGGLAGGLSIASVPWMVMKDNVSVFKSLSDEEIGKLSDEDKAKYWNDLIKWQTKTIKEQETLIAKGGADTEEIKKQLAELQKAN